MAAGEHNRVMQTTIAEYVLGAENATLRTRKLPALMKAKGRITFNHSGTSLNWGIRHKQRDLEGYSDGDLIQFARSDNFKRAELPWRGYVMGDMVTRKEKLMNRGKPALIKYVSELTEHMVEDFKDRFHAQFYVDGNATGNAKKYHGYDSFTAATVNAGKLVATPNDTYAGLSTVLGTYGGSWTGDWPSGQGDSEYDFFSPIVVDYTNTGWLAATKTWPNTCHEALRYGIIKSKRNDSTEGMIDVIILDGELFRNWEDSQLDSKERVIVQGGTGKPTLRNLGFGDVVTFEGTEVTWEYGVPADANGVAQGYGFNVDKMELCCLDDRIFKTEGPFFDESTLSDRFLINMFGNFKFNPRYFAKWAKYS